MGTTVQPLPLHFVANGSRPNPEFVWPTARQRFALGHVTSASTVDWPATVGLGEIDQLLPFHRSTSGRVRIAFRSTPTAKHLLALVHTTDVSDASTLGVGLGTVAQLLPFHR